MKYKRVILPFVLGLFAIIGMTGCEELGIHRSMRAVTGEASNITALSAMLSGQAHLPRTLMTDLSFGIVYSPDESFPVDNTIERMAVSADSDYKYSVYTLSLEPEMTYYYRSFISQNGEIAYGETRSFTTPGVSTLIKTLAPSDITASSVTLNAFLDQDCQAPLSGYGFRIDNNGQQKLIRANNRSDNGFSLTDYDINSETTYLVTAYLSTYTLKSDSKPNTYLITGEKTYFASETIPFTTKAIEANLALDEATGVSETQARLSGSLATSWDRYVIKIDIIYSSSANTIDELKSSGIVAGYYLDYEKKGLFWADLRNLQPDTEYYWAVVAHVNDAVFESEVKSFHTACYSAEITSSLADNVSFTYATMRGQLNVTSVEPLEKETWFLYSASSSSIDELLASGTKVTASLDDTGAMTAKVDGFFDGTTYYFVPAAKILGKTCYGEVSTFTTDTLPTGAVDLGVALQWASCNVGASSPEDLGDTFLWGETVPRTTDGSWWGEYSLCDDGNERAMNKYCVQSRFGKVDNKRVLEPIDDAANKNLGGHWRMPTDAEWQTLMNPSKCTWTRTKMGDTVGYIVTGKKTGKSIFIPTIEYWSSSLYTTQSNQAWAYDVYYYDPEYYNYYPGSYEIGLCRAPIFRCFAFHVRAVMPFSAY